MNGHQDTFPRIFFWMCEYYMHNLLTLQYTKPKPMLMSKSRRLSGAHLHAFYGKVFDLNHKNVYRIYISTNESKCSPVHTNLGRMTNICVSLPGSRWFRQRLCPLPADCQSETLEQISVKFWSKYYNFHSGKWISIHHLQSGDNLIAVSMWWHTDKWQCLLGSRVA